MERIGPIPVRTPFPDIAMHVIKPPRVGWIGLDRGRAIHRQPSGLDIRETFFRFYAVVAIHGPSAFVCISPGK